MAGGVRTPAISLFDSGFPQIQPNKKLAVERKASVWKPTLSDFLSCPRLRLEIKRSLAGFHVEGHGVMRMRQHPFFVDLSEAERRPPPHIKLYAIGLCSVDAMQTVAKATSSPAVISRSRSSIPIGPLNQENHSVNRFFIISVPLYWIGFTRSYATASAAYGARDPSTSFARTDDIQASINSRICPLLSISLSGFA